MKLTKREHKLLYKLITASIYRTMSDARIAACSSYDDTLIAKLDRIEGYAYAATVAIIERVS